MHRAVSPIARIPALLLLGLLAIGQAAGRERGSFREAVADPPPQAYPLEVEVPRGGPVYIALRAYSITSPIIRFRIRRAPEDGRLGAPELLAPDSGRVKYTPPPGAGPGDDSFAYAVQSEKGVSAPAEVHIRLTDREPELSVPAELDFGDVLTGGSAVGSLVIQNIGGGLAEGEVRVPESWEVRGNPAYSLAAGAKATFDILFRAPAEEKLCTADIEYTSHRERATDLRANAVAPVAVDRPAVELAPAGNMMMGAIRVINRTDVPKALSIVAGPALEVDGTAEAPAHGVIEVYVRARQPGEEIKDTVLVSTTGLNAAVSVHAVAVHSSPVPAIAPAGLIARAASTPAAGRVVPASVLDANAAGLTLPDAGGDQSAETWTGLRIAPLQVEAAGPHAVRLSCEFSDVSTVHEWRVEVQEVTIDDQGRIRTRWAAAPGARPEAREKKVTVELRHLPAGMLCVTRIVGVDAAGNVAAITASADVWTTPQSRSGWWPWALGGGAIALAAWWWRGRRRAGGYEG